MKRPERAQSRSFFPGRVGIIGLLVLALSSVASPVSATTSLPSDTAQQESSVPRSGGDRPGSTQFALFGDVPYGEEAIRQFPETMKEISTYPGVKYAVHVGDIKSGSSRCDSSYFSWVKKEFDASRVPLIYTPGDNEWTDCHRQNNGAYNPLERMDALRQIFFSRPDKALGQGTMPLKNQARWGLPENAEWVSNGVEFATVNIQGSHNGREPWSGLGKKEATPEQLREVSYRTSLASVMISKQFADAARKKGSAVAIVLQADMFDSYLAQDPASARAAFGQIIKTIAAGARITGLPTYILNGDSHKYREGNPLAAGSPWLSVYGVPSVPNLKQVTVEGAAESHEFTLVNVASPRGRGADRENPLTFSRIKLSTAPAQ